jgi:hypothetical protein
MSKALYSSISRSLFLRLIEKEIPDWLDQSKGLKELINSTVKRERVFGKQVHCLDMIARQAPTGTLLKLRDDPNWTELLIFTDGSVIIKRSATQVQELLKQVNMELWSRRSQLMETMAVAMMREAYSE